MKHILFIFALCLLGACTQKPAPLSTYGAAVGAGSAGMHTVASGDTLYSLSRRYKVEVPAIVSVNHLSAPFRLNVGQRLRVPTPQLYEVHSGDTVFTVARIFGVTASDLAQENALRPPYKIYAGQKLKLPSGYDAGHKSADPVPVPAAYVQHAPVQAAPVQRVMKSDLSAIPVAAVPVSMVQPRPTPKLALTTPRTFMRPVSGKVISNYGAKSNGLHNDGVNIAAARGAAVTSAADGQVVYAGSGIKGYGNMVLVKHGGGYLTAYGHLEKITVRKGDFLRSGQSLGTVGTSGQVKSPQLHFEIRKGTNAINPGKYV